MTLTDLVELPVFDDARGKLSFGEVGKQLPFVPERYFLVFDTEGGGIVRGGHAHRHCSQFLVAVSGCVVVTTDDGDQRVEHRLDRPAIGLHIPPEVWAEQRYLTADARLLVLASHAYDPSEYITEYDEFLTLTGGSR